MGHNESSSSVPSYTNIPVPVCGPQYCFSNQLLSANSLQRTHRAQWLRGRVSDARPREPGFNSCAAVLKPWASFFHSTLLQFTQLYR